MVRLANPRLVKQLQKRAEAYAYGDYGCLIKLVGTGTYDDNNTETKTTVEVPMDCSFTEKPTQEIWRDYADIGQVDAEVRFVGHDPQKGDKFRIESRFDGIAHASSVDNFEVIGINNRYTFGYVVALRKVFL